MSKKIAPDPNFEHQHSILDAIKQNFSDSINQIDEIQEIPKKKLNGIVFLLNVLWMLLCCHGALFYFFLPLQQAVKRGSLAGIILVVTIIVAFPTFYYLTNLTTFLRLALILDNIQLFTIISSLGFLSLVLIFDTDIAYWQYKILQVGFVVEAFCYSMMTRVMFVAMDWSKWQVIVFKFHSMMNCLLFFICGTYFIYQDFSYTNHLLKKFDSKVHDLTILFIFTMFQCMSMLYRKITDLDHTGDLKYTYTMKNVDENHHKKTRNIMKKRRESIEQVSNVIKKISFVFKKSEDNTT